MRISVITTTFRRPEMLRRCIESVRAQTHGDVEHIVVSDGFHAPTEEVVAELLDSKDHRFEFIAHLWEGQAVAFNYGLRKATGDLVTLLNDDDTLAPDWCAAAAAHMAGCNCILAYADCEWTYDWVKWTPHPHPSKVTFEETTVEQKIAGVGGCLRAEAIKAEGGLRHILGHNEDWDLQLRLLRHGKACYVPNALSYRYTVHPLSKSLADRGGMKLSRRRLQEMVAKGEYRHQEPCWCGGRWR